ncbi:DUF402 domain-containing protein [Pseudobacillus sp. 179-B 2D1 NHS]|uniref:DUF402 domain-containing protein n=1 Tax=Pseudobacillus sp. 179-B 2D1 NHS TaxID=3374292 RepID=UPI0038796839
MIHLNTSINQYANKIIERKIRYDSTIVEHVCKLLKAQDQKIVLFHKIKESFTMTAEKTSLTIPKGSYTIAYYWKDRPYNAYVWRDGEGNYLGSYFNIVKNTQITGQILSFEDLIIDVLALPNGSCFVLDEDELSEPLDQFEKGTVQQALHSLMNTLDVLLPEIILETEQVYKHEELFYWLKD